MLHFVLLSGGSGTRLWPLSNESRSKQFLKVLRDDDGKPVSMVQRVFSQIAKIDAEHDITIATCENQQVSIAKQVDGEYRLVLEPQRRDTAAAIMLACSDLRFEQHFDPEDTVIVMPIDIYAEQGFYDSSVQLDKVIQRGNADLALLGVSPTYPSEKYGYIVPTNHEGTYWAVSEFREKPTGAQAEKLIEAGALWNCGVFAFKLGYILNILKNYIQADSLQDTLLQYESLPKISFDFEVVENASNIVVIPYGGEWKDLGTWNTLSEEMAEVSAGRVIVDEDTCENVHVINETGMPMIVTGINDAVIVATPDGILASGKYESSFIKDKVNQIAESRPMYERRRWGEYRVIDSSVSSDGSKSLVKELVIDPGSQLSYQSHGSRSESWTVVSGKGQVVQDGIVIDVGPGDTVQISEGTKHSCRAFTELHLIEIQLGDILIEQDIERYGDFW